MRIFTAILFLTGCYWALFAWIGALSIFAILFSDEPIGLQSFIISLLSSLTFTTGYLIWLGWGFYTIKNRLPFIKKKTFGQISLIQLFFMLLILIIALLKDNSDLSKLFTLEGLLWLIFDCFWFNLWLFINLLVSVCFFKEFKD